MTRGRARTHLDASEAGKLRVALCGWTFVDTTQDVTAVDCKACLSALRRSRTASPRKLDAKVQALLAPSAGPPPRLTAQIWETSCRGGLGGRCLKCALCDWERSAAIWHHAAPWNLRLRAEQPDEPRWPSAAAALRAYAEWLVHRPEQPSPLGGILDRVERGETMVSSGVLRDAACTRAVDDVDPVYRALMLAFPGNEVGAHCLLARTPGVLDPMLTYAELALRTGLTEGSVQSLVRSGREKVTAELVRRGVIPVPRERARMQGGASCLMAGD